MKTKLVVTELTHDDLVTFLSDAFAQGYFSGNYLKVDYETIPKEKRIGDCFEDKMADVLLSGESVSIFDSYAEENNYGNLPFRIDHQCGEVEYYVTLEDILKGFSLDDAQEYVMQLQNEDDDAWTGYNLMQCVLFGEIIYG